MKPTAEDAWQAAQAVGRLLEALANGDDLVAIQSTSSEIHERFGTGEGFAARLREAFGIDQELASRIGVSSKVRVVSGTMVLVCFEVAEGETTREVGAWGPVKMQVWPLSATLEGASWRVSGSYIRPDGEWPDGTEYLDLPTAPPPRGPTQ
jgi:hypothetical protein